MLKTLAGGRRKTSVGGNLRRTSVGRNLGKTSAVSFELTNYLICDAPSPLVVRRRRRMMAEENKSCFKSPETSGGCSPRCTDLWHQKFLLMSKPLWVWWSTEDREYASFDFFQIDSNLGKMYSGIHIFFELFLKRRREVLGRTSVGGNLGRTSVGRNFDRISSYCLRIRHIVQ